MLWMILIEFLVDSYEISKRMVLINIEFLGMMYVYPKKREDYDLDLYLKCPKLYL